MASQEEHGATSVASAEALAFWQWLEVVAQDASALQEWQALTAQERESWLLERGFQLEELELGLAALSRSAVIRPAEAQAARSWLDQGLLPTEQQLKMLLSLAVTRTTDLGGRGGGGSYPVEHPVRRWRADRDRWTTELSDKEESLGRREREEHTEIVADALEAKETWHFLQREKHLDQLEQHSEASVRKMAPWLSGMETKGGRNEWYKKQLSNQHLVISDTWEQVAPNDYVQTPTWYQYTNAKAWPRSNGETTISLNITWQRSTANLDGGTNGLTISLKIEAPKKDASFWISRDNISKSVKKGNGAGFQIETINYDDGGSHLMTPWHPDSTFRIHTVDYIKKERNIVNRLSSQTTIAKDSGFTNKKQVKFDAFQTAGKWRSATVWGRDQMLLHVGWIVHKRARSGSELAKRIQQRAIAGAIGQEIKNNLGNPILLIPAVMAANKQRRKLKSTIQTTRSTYQAAVAAIPLNNHGEQKYETDGQLELQSIHEYWDEGVARDQDILQHPKGWVKSYQKDNIKHQYDWSNWVDTSQKMFYDSEKNAIGAGIAEYKSEMATGMYTKRQARNIATAYYFDELIQEDMKWAEKLKGGLVVEYVQMGIDMPYEPLVFGASAMAFAPEVLQRQIRMAKWVIYTDRHPFLWQRKLKFKIDREKYLNKAINKWYLAEQAAWKSDGFFKKCWHFTEHTTDVFLKGIERTLGHILKWELKPAVWGLNEVSKLWGGDLGTHLLTADPKIWHASWYIFDHILKNTVLLPYRLGRSLKRLDGQFWRWLKKGAHPKGFWDGLKKDTRSLQHLVENIEFAILSLKTWGHAKYLMPHTAHRLHQEWRSIKFAANHPKIFRKQEQDLLRLETKSVIRIDVIALKAWKTVARNTNLIKSPAHYFASQEWRWIKKNKPKQAAIISHDISTTKSMAKRGAKYEKTKFASESKKTKVKQLRWLRTSSPTEKQEVLMKYLATPISQWSTHMPININQGLPSKKQELYSTLWGDEKAEVKGMMHSVQEESKSKYGRGLVSMNLRFDIDLVTALHKSSQKQRRALGSTWAVIMAWPTITSNLKADKKEDKAQYTKWQKKFQNATSYDWSGMGGNEGLSITQSLVNAFIFSITSSATEKKLRNWTKNRGKGDGLQAFRLIILAYMAPNIQTINGYINNDIKSGIKQQYSLAQRKYDQLNRLDRMLITREFEKSPKLRSALQKDYRQLKKLDRKLDMIQRLGRVKITDARLKNAKQSWQDKTLLVPVTTLVQRSKRWSSLTANQQATYSSKYTKWLTTNQHKKTRTLKKDVDRTKGTSSNLHTQQQAWSSDQAAIASGDRMTVGQIVVSMKPIGNPDAKNPTSWQSVSTPDIRSIQAGLERQFSNLAITSGTTPPAPTPAPSPNPEIKPVQLLTLCFQIRHFDLVYRRINRAIDKHWYGLDDAEIKGLSDADVKKLRELGWSDEKVDRVRNILKTDSSPWQDFKKLKSQIDLEADLNEFSELERQQLEDLLLARDGKKIRVIRDSLRLENEVAQKGIDDTVSSVERDLEQAVEDRFSGDIDNVVIDIEGNAAGEIEAVADGAAVEEETLIKAEIEAEEVAADEALETTIEAAEIAAM